GAPVVNNRNVEKTSAEIYWDASPYPPGTTYTISLNGSVAATNVAGATYTFTGLTPSTNYTASVVAVLPAGGGSSPPGSTSFRTKDPDDSGDPGGGPDPTPIGNSSIVFSPNSSGEVPGNRNGWVNTSIPVTASVSGDTTITKTVNVNWSWNEPQPDQCSTGEDGNEVCTPQPDIVHTGSSTYSKTWTIGPVNITGSAGGAGSVVLSAEGANLSLTANAHWNLTSQEWDLPPDPEAGVAVPDIQAPADLTATSGIYKIDKTPP
ncbi:fibronectin type III domain-containing protein, partial [Desulfocucumis palustris]|uniref:fibronectin type III domain-containing protein n=1 Tax=Desulfocucumis palustris TaxID=1898651 RepID=UPI0013FE25F2